MTGIISTCVKPISSARSAVSLPPVRDRSASDCPPRARASTNRGGPRKWRWVGRAPGAAPLRRHARDPHRYSSAQMTDPFRGGISWRTANGSAFSTDTPVAATRCDTCRPLPARPRHEAFPDSRCAHDLQRMPGRVPSVEVADHTDRLRVLRRPNGELHPATPATVSGCAPNFSSNRQWVPSWNKRTSASVRRCRLTGASGGAGGAAGNGAGTADSDQRHRGVLAPPRREQPAFSFLSFGLDFRLRHLSFASPVSTRPISDICSTCATPCLAVNQ